ncbi:hypothetical protein ACJMK2_038633, partial [Sinanodonta woodiana]
NTTLRCRVCKHARSLDDCTLSQTCSENEECYTDELIDPYLHILFNSGCRSIATCRGPLPRPGRAITETLLACSRCCDTRLQNSSSSHSEIECNANLCGLKPAFKPRCRSCVNARTIDNCTGHVTCGQNE